MLNRTFTQYHKYKTGKTTLMKLEICLQHVISIIRSLDGAKLSRACVLNAAVERAGNSAKSVLFDVVQSLRRML